MKSSRTRTQARVAKQTLQIAALAPVVATARIAQVASTGNYGAIARMGTEKASAFTSAAIGMMFAGAATIAKLTLVTANAWSPWGGTAAQRAGRVRSALLDAPNDVARGALKPISKRVVANARRLGR